MSTLQSPTRIRLRRIRSVSPQPLAVALCLGKLYQELRAMLPSEAHAHAPYPCFREWLRGEGMDRLIHPEWERLQALLGDAAPARFQALALAVLQERETVTCCDSCKFPVPLVTCEIDWDESTACPRCAEADLQERLNRVRPGGARVFDDAFEEAA